MNPKRQTARELHELQRLMAGAVMRPLTGDGDMQPSWTDGRATAKVAAEFIKPNDRLTAFERLEIYNRQYWYRIKDCFFEDCPGLRAILGDRKFERLADAYLAQHPSRSFTLRNLGRSLVNFLAANPRLAAPQTQLALDMARLEWAHTEAFDNEARAPLQTDDLLGLDAGKLRFQLQPHLSLLQLEHEVDDFLIAIKRNAGLRAEASNAVEQRKKSPARLQRTLKRKTIYLAVHRFGDTVFYKRLNPAQFRLLSALRRGATLEAACTEVALAKIFKGDFAVALRKWFENWASLGWFCGLESPPVKPQPKRKL